jgi:hypothetical protein
MKINLWKDGEFTDSANKVMFVVALSLGLSGFVYELITIL